LNVLINVTLARSNSALPEDGDYTKTCRCIFNVSFNTPLKTCASVGVKTLIQQEFWLSQQNFTMHVETLFKV
jgi:hypothetical protein